MCDIGDILLIGNIKISCNKYIYQGKIIMDS
jgi:hypothetical protein